MLDLRLREEFRGKRLRGTTVDFTNENKTGALDVSAAEFLKITYPSSDMLKTIESTGPGQSRPVVLLGARGQGKSHLLAALYHLATNSAEGRPWLDEWGARLHRPELSKIQLRSDCCVIAESVHNHDYKFLWDILFERHPEGSYGKGLWDAQGDKKTEVPGQKILLEIFKRHPTMLILDEFQTWYDGLTNTKQYPWRYWAFNFIQILSEIAQKNPDLLVLVVSVRDGGSDAYQQIHRVNPVLVDFQGPQARRDRRRLLLHRIFENRTHVPDAKIRGVIHTHLQEYLRLAKIPEPDHERRSEDFVEAWPFAPHLLQLLDDQVLIAADAQKNRDLIKILVDVYKQSEGDQALVTAADFSLTNERSAVASLLESVANPLHRDLRQKALRNLEAVQNAVPQAAKALPHCESIINALWLRSLTLEKVAGADPADLQIDVTRNRAIDDNAFEAELATIEGESFNIHRIGNRLVFKHEENLRTKLLAFAKNDKLFTEGAHAGQDIEHLAKEVRSVISGPEHVSQGHRVVVLKRRWDSEPWSEFEEKDLSKNWDGRLPLIVLPQYPDKMETTLGEWLKRNLQEGRNTIRFLLPQKGNPSIYYDRELIVLARAIYLAMQWKKEDLNYGELERKFRGDLVGKLKGRFDRFAVLDVWSFGDTSKCVFHEQAHGALGDKIPGKIDDIIRQDVFVPEEFEDYVLGLAEHGESLGKLLRELREPRSGGNPSIPWLGEVAVKERVTRMCAAGQIAVNLRGMTMLQATPTETEDEAWNRMKGRIAGVTGKQLDEVTIHKPGSVAVSGGTTSGNGSGLGGIFGGAAGTETTGSGIGAGTDTGTGTGGIGDLFGGSSGTATATPYSATPTSGLNLLGLVVDRWGIGPATAVSNVNLNVGKMTGAQLQALLKHLPDGVTYGLDLEKE
jgi:Protein of unknown function (DUF499)